jgi:hypothetical protein
MSASVHLLLVTFAMGFPLNGALQAALADPIVDDDAEVRGGDIARPLRSLFVSASAY